MTEKNELNSVSTHQLRMELAKREAAERQEQAIRSANTQADEQFAIIVDTYFEAIEKFDKEMEGNRERYDTVLLDSLRSILDAYWKQQSGTWKEKGLPGQQMDRALNFNDLVADVPPGFLDG
jgi:hypothetical protein